MNYIHQELASGRWFRLSLIEQLANIGSEVERAISWRKKNQQYYWRAVERALELLDLTITDEKNRKRLKEITRLREILVDYFYYDNEYATSDEFLKKYFYHFTFVARNFQNI